MPSTPAVPGSKRVTIRQVAERAGVSTSAVSHTFNGRADIGEATRERIMAAARDLNWRPTAAALALAASRTQTVGYIVRRDPDRVRSDPFFVDVFAGMQTALAAQHYNLLARIVPTADEEIEAYHNLSQRRQVDGFVLVDHQADDPRYPIIVEAGLAAVAIGRTAGDCPFPAVVSDPTEPGLREAFRTLAGLGHHRVGYVGGPNDFVHSAFRLDRVREAASDAGTTLLEQTTTYTSDGSAAATRALLRTAAPPTAIVYTNDWMALWGAAEAQAMGIRVPEDLSIVGHDDAPFAAHARPALATVREEVASLADNAARMLLALIAGEELPDLPAPPTRFLPRESIARRTVDR
jgi:DNA-binding LacI/PurR family transcriptional regulator